MLLHAVHLNMVSSIEALMTEFAHSHLSFYCRQGLNNKKGDFNYHEQHVRAHTHTHFITFLRIQRERMKMGGN